MSAFRAGLLGLGPWGIWGIKTAQFDLSAACERSVWARRWVTNPEYIEALCVNPTCPIRICHKWVCLGSKRPHFYVLFDGETDRVEKFIFCKKKDHMTKKCPKAPLSPHLFSWNPLQAAHLGPKKGIFCVFFNVTSGQITQIELGWSPPKKSNRQTPPKWPMHAQLQFF